MKQCVSLLLVFVVCCFGTPCIYHDVTLGSLEEGPLCQRLGRRIDVDREELDYYGGFKCPFFQQNAQRCAYTALLEAEREDLEETSFRAQCTIGSFTLTSHRWAAARCDKAVRIYTTCVETELTMDVCFARAVVNSGLEL